MSRMLYRLGLLLGGLILALFIATNLINLRDPYRIVTENLVSQVAAEPQRTVRLNAYGTLSSQIRQMLYTEETATLAVWLDEWQIAGLIKLLPLSGPVDLLVDGLDTAVHEIAALDSRLVLIREAERLSGDLARLHYYDLDHGDRVLADLYEQSRLISPNLAAVAEGLDDVATAVSTVTTMPGVEKFQQSLGKVARPEADLVYQSIESWQGVPANIESLKQQIDNDVAWLTNFEQEYEVAKQFNDRWQFDTLRIIPRLTAEFYRPLLWGVVGSLLLAVAGWWGSYQPVHQRTARRPMLQRRPLSPKRSLPQPSQSKPIPSLSYCWPDGRREYQRLPKSGEVTIGSIVIRRARVRYYLERIDPGFPALLNGCSIAGAHILTNGDVIQIGELRAVFQIAA